MDFCGSKLSLRAESILNAKILYHTNFQMQEKYLIKFINPEKKAVCKKTAKLRFLIFGTVLGTVMDRSLREIVEKYTFRAE